MSWPTESLLFYEHYELVPSPIRHIEKALSNLDKIFYIGSRVKL